MSDNLWEDFLNAYYCPKDEETGNRPCDIGIICDKCETEAAEELYNLYVESRNKPRKEVRQLPVYLVTDIKINDDIPYKVKVPAVYTCAPELVKCYLRLHAFQYKEVTFNYEESAITAEHYTTEVESYENNSVDILEVDYINFGGYKEAEVKPIHKNTSVVFFTPDELDDARTVEQTIFEVLMDHLPVDFIVKELEDEKEV